LGIVCEAIEIYLCVKKAKILKVFECEISADSGKARFISHDPAVINAKSCAQLRVSNLPDQTRIKVTLAIASSAFLGPLKGLL